LSKPVQYIYIENLQVRYYISSYWNNPIPAAQVFIGSHQDVQKTVLKSYGTAARVNGVSVILMISTTIAPSRKTH
jgi:hypothetical protein